MEDEQYIKIMIMNERRLECEAQESGPVENLCEAQVSERPSVRYCSELVRSTSERDIPQIPGIVVSVSQWPLSQWFCMVFLVN